MRGNAIKRWLARGAGFAGMLAVSFPLTFSEVEPAEAASPVCFYIYAKCFCVDFFTTEMSDMVWGEFQDYINELYQDFRDEQLDSRLRDILPTELSPEDLAAWDTYSDDIKVYLRDRALEELGVDPEEVTSATSILEEHPEVQAYLAEHAEEEQGGNHVLPKVRALAYAYANPESLAPYVADKLSGGDASPEEVALVKAWADRMFVAPAPPDDLSDETLATMTVDQVDKAYLDTRMHVAGSVAQEGLMAPMIHEGTLVGLEEQRRALEQIAEAANATVADMESGNVLAAVVQGQALLRRLESNLRQERLLGTVIALDQDLATQEASR